ncbi:protein eva-1 homolog C isoform X4 [Symphalangus syndactylus]|uniref:protein eva-1 homolog C isoform X4 n=1 Tax=Symphalangus syndactylus TaxID=9590 RepID=UPI0024420460|nr:protein eva-1 homolog C isoform X4 [Symphalangus syndactylus]
MCQVTARGARRVAGMAAVRSHASRTPPSRGPRWAPPRGRPSCTRGAGSKVRHGHRPRSFCRQGEAGTRPARAGPRVPGCFPGVEGAQGARPRTRYWGRPPRLAARQGSAWAAAGRAKAALSLRPPSLPPARRQRRFPLGETTRILFGDPRPAPVLRPLPFAGAPGLARAGEEALAACAGRRRGAAEPLAIDSPRHVTPSLALRPPARPGPAPPPRPAAQRTMLLPGPARQPPTPQPAQHPGLRRQVEPPGQLLRLFYCTVLVCSKEISALTDFSDELKNKTVCEDQELKLHCHESKFLNIYSATYGRRTQERDICSSEAEWLPPFDCLSYSALQVLSRRCYGKQRCKIIVNNHHFGSPCLPGVKKYLTVTYACVPKNILTAIDPAIANLKPSLKQKDGEYGINFDPSGSKVLRKDGILVSNSLAAFAYIRAHPERAALLFVSSVCIGLALTLCALVIRESCAKDFHDLQLGREQLVPGSDKVEEDSEDEEEEEDSSESDFPGELSGFCRTSYPVYSSIEAAELAERIERREQIIQEIWMNSGLDTSLPRNMGQFY